MKIGDKGYWIMTGFSGGGGWALKVYEVEVTKVNPIHANWNNKVRIIQPIYGSFFSVPAGDIKLVEDLYRTIEEVKSATKRLILRFVFGKGLGDKFHNLKQLITTMNKAR